jgi:RNA polymerase sigma factor (sigma-70 family)
MKDDALLHQFIEAGSQPAFAELVQRHLDLVYSVALRGVRSPDLAADVSQLVFMDLARQAGEVARLPSLVAWLHVVARRKAIDLVRSESRRRAREQIAAELTMTPSTSRWSEIEPLLDAAVEALVPSDRAALVLRYFENKSLREVGCELGVSDDTAQKRVARALDRVRDALRQRGVVITTGVLATTLSAHAVQRAPTALAGAIAAASATVALLPAGNLIFSTTKLAAVLATSAALLTGYVTAQGWNLRTELRNTHDEAIRLSAAASSLRRERDALRQQLAASAKSHAVATNQSPTDAAIEARISEWLQRMDQVKAALALRPQLAIPELRLLPDKYWYFATAYEDFTTPGKLEYALLLLRRQAKSNFAQQVFDALGKSDFKTNPFDFATLLSRTTMPIGEILSRYDARRENGVITISERDVQLTDDEPLLTITWDMRGKGANGNMSCDSPSDRAIQQAQSEFSRQHGGESSMSFGELRPYFPAGTDEQKVAKKLSR